MPTTLPFRRLAVVLAGGGGLGAYQVGVLRVLTEHGLRPAILAGTSVGAMNAVVWLAHDLDPTALERAWRKLRPAAIGLRWTTLTLRAAGLAIAAYGAIQALLTLAGSPEFAVGRRLLPRADAGIHAWLDLVAWVTLAVIGWLAVRLSRPLERWLAAWPRPGEEGRESGWLGYVLAGWAVLHTVMWGLGLPWPHGFSATLLAVGTVAWIMARPGRPGLVLRGALARLLPETRGRGLWGESARRRLMDSLIQSGDPARLCGAETTLIVDALDLGTGRIAHFTSGPRPSGDYVARIEAALGEVVWVSDPRMVLDAVVASSAIPLAFEPVRIRGREYVDAGQFSNQAVGAALAAGADAVLVVLMVPSTGPGESGSGAHLIDLGARFVDLANWRQLRHEIAALPAAWSASTARPHPLCVVEPPGPLSGALLAFEPAVSVRLMEQGRDDARRALAAAGWIGSAATG